MCDLIQTYMFVLQPRLRSHNEKQFLDLLDVTLPSARLRIRSTGKIIPTEKEHSIFVCKLTPSVTHLSKYRMYSQAVNKDTAGLLGDHRGDSSNKDLLSGD